MEQTIWAIGDLHADVHCARHWVHRSGLVRNLSAPSSYWTWSDPNAQLIFMGDYIDKGPYARATLEFIRTLETTFPSSVTALLGNHELNLLLDRARSGGRYMEYAFGVAHPLQYLDWDTGATELGAADSRDALAAIHEALDKIYAENAHARYKMVPDGPWSIVERIEPPQLRPVVARCLRRWQDAYLLGVSSNSLNGAWLQQRPLLALRGGTLWVHGGIPPSFFEKRINHASHWSLHDYAATHEDLLSTRGLSPYLLSADGVELLNGQWRNASHKHEGHGASDGILSRSSLQMAYTGHDALHSAHEAELALARSEVVEIVSELVEYRGLHDPRKGCARVEKLLDALNKHLRESKADCGCVKRIAVGHTPGNSVRQMCDGQLLAVDSALGRDFRRTGNLYCDSRKGAKAGVAVTPCVSPETPCEGQIVRLDGRKVKEKDDEGEFDSWSWEVHVIESGGGEVEEAGHKVEL